MMSDAAVPPPRTIAQRQQSWRDARRARGLKELRNLWVHPDDEQAVRELAAKLQARRERAAKRG